MAIYKDLKISVKFILITSLVFISASLSYYWVFKHIYNETLKNIIEYNISQTEEGMRNFEKEDTKALSSTMEVLLRDREFKDVYLSGDRDRLYEVGRPLFKELRDRYGITHFYFHLPTGINFVRLHDKRIHGDKIDRVTFEKARVSQKFASGIELGKTAFALRVVAPYYDNGKLIGYMELGEEINHFLEALKRGTSNEFAIIANKEYLNREDWGSVRRSAGLPDNWDESEKHLWISKPSENPLIKGCFNEENMERFEAGTKIMPEFAGLKQGYACGGFPIIDASNRQVGIVLALINISEETALVKKTRLYIIAIFIVLSLIAFILLNLLTRALISNPIKRLSGAVGVMAGGDLAHRVRVDSGDEIGLLGNAVNDMASRLEGLYRNLEERVAQRTEELLAANEEMTVGNEELQSAYSQLEITTSDLEAANEAVVKSNEELKSLERLKTEFLQTVSHELRSPLTPILGYLELLKEGDIGAFSAKQKEIFEEMHLCGKNMQMIVDELLEVASIQAGKLILDYKDVDLHPILRQAVKGVKKYADDHHIVIETRFSSDPLLAVGDRHSLAEIFTHLVRNAVKFSREKGLVKVEAAAKGQGVEIKVSDNGIGIAKDKLEKIYEAFYQVDSSSARLYEGVGLGLYLVKRLVDMHSGLIEVQSEEGLGSTFTVFIPRNRQVRTFRSEK